MPLGLRELLGVIHVPLPLDDEADDNARGGDGLALPPSGEGELLPPLAAARQACTGGRILGRFLEAWPRLFLLPRPRSAVPFIGPAIAIVKKLLKPHSHRYNDSSVVVTSQQWATSAMRETNGQVTEGAVDSSVNVRAALCSDEVSLTPADMSSCFRLTSSAAANLALAIHPQVPPIRTPPHLILPLLSFSSHASEDVCTKPEPTKISATPSPACLAVGHHLAPGEVDTAAKLERAGNPAVPTSPHSSANGPVVPIVGVDVDAKRGGNSRSATPTSTSDPRLDRGVVDVAAENVLNEDVATPTASAASSAIGRFPIVSCSFLPRPLAFLSLDGSKNPGMLLRLLGAALLHGLFLPLVEPPGDDALTRARKQVHPPSGRAGSLVRPGGVEVAARAVQPHGEDDAGWMLARIRKDLVELAWPSSALSCPFNSTARSAPMMATTGDQGTAGRTTSLAIGGTTLGKAHRPPRGEQRRAREEGGDADARPNTRSRKVDTVSMFMVKKPAVTSRSRPALLLLLRNRSSSSLSVSLSAILNDGAFVMTMGISLAPAVGPHTPILAGRCAGSAAALRHVWRGAASQRVAPCTSATRATAFMAGVPSAFGPSSTRAGRVVRMASDPATPQELPLRESPLTQGQRDGNYGQGAREEAPRVLRAASLASRLWPCTNWNINAGAGSLPPTPPADGNQAAGVHLPKT